MTRPDRVAMTAAAYQGRMTEKDMEQTVRALVELRGGRLFHVRDARTSPELADLPDWLIIDPMSGRVLLIEAKSQKRQVTMGQAAVLMMLDECSRFEGYVVRPVPKHPGEVAFDDFVEFLRLR